MLGNPLEIPRLGSALYFLRTGLFTAVSNPDRPPGVPLPSEVLGDGPLEAGQEGMGCDRTVG